MINCIVKDGFSAARCKKCSDYELCRQMVSLLFGPVEQILRPITKLEKIKQELGNIYCKKCKEKEYQNKLHWSSDLKKFICDKGHKESFKQAYNCENEDTLFYRLRNISKII